MILGQEHYLPFSGVETATNPLSQKIQVDGWEPP